ncbi:EAL and GGDEF domain-containing protein [Thiomicrorhabdus aquaedulcis]|uniref:sensor domain-containing protein n=1 Tax=Thiomicrorhabdus aquaedulcis TaxID=2211106 RepID=UPI000FD94969|nr:bifunctional diguanylate cyclase/phosphodiesterase [Thiomicrorhabdus aquaedulcis]
MTIFSKHPQNMNDILHWFELLNALPNPVTLNRSMINDQGVILDQIVFVNTAFQNILGYCVEDIPTDQAWFKKAYPDPIYQAMVKAEWFNALEKAQQTQSHLLAFPAKVMCKDQTTRWFQITSHLNSPIAKHYHAIVLVEIAAPEHNALVLQETANALMKSNLELQKNALQLRETQKIAQIGSWELDLVTHQFTWSQEIYDFYQEDPTCFTPTLDYVLKRSFKIERDAMLHALTEAQKTGQKQRVMATIIRKNGQKRMLEMVAQILFDAQQLPIKILGTTIDITDLLALKQDNLDLAHLIEIAHKEIFIIDPEHLKFRYANQAALENLGYTYDELMALSLEHIDSNMQKTLKKPACRAEIEHPKPQKITLQSRLKRKNGSDYFVQSSLQKIHYKGHMAYAIFNTDITALKTAENSLMAQNGLLEKIINTVPTRIFWKDLNGHYLGANNLFLQDAQLTDKNQLIGKTDFDMPWADTNAQYYRHDDQKVINTGHPKLQFEEKQTTSNGQTIYLLTSKVPLQNEQNQIIGTLGTYDDITERRFIENQLLQQKEFLRYQAHYDALTGLPNRVLFQDRLQQTIQKSKRHAQQFALLFIDLDQFKQINDSLGHDIGDQVLKMVAANLKSALGEEDTLARLGGDEFTIIVQELNQPQDASILANKILDITKQPFQIDEHSLYLSSSIGISIYPKDAQTAEELLKYADAAMYRAKDEGRDNFQFYTADMTTLAFEHIAMQASLRQAIKNQEFVVYYQPQINALTHCITGMEALVRWQHPIMGLVPPNKFIPLAESTGVIVELDRLVMRMAMQQFAQWVAQGFNPGTLSLNLSAKQTEQTDFLKCLTKTLTETQCQAHWLELEVTESDLMKNPDIAIEQLNQIRQLGISLAIDDFGTGYSSLAYLKRLPVTKLKIDQSFVRDLPQDEDDAAITKAIIAMATSLGLKLIAEGVETAQQRDFLLQNGCNNIQGYFYSRPINAKHMTQFMRDFNSPGLVNNNP